MSSWKLSPLASFASGCVFAGVTAAILAAMIPGFLSAWQGAAYSFSWLRQGGAAC